MTGTCAAGAVFTFHPSRPNSCLVLDRRARPGRHPRRGRAGSAWRRGSDVSRVPVRRWSRVETSPGTGLRSQNPWQHLLGRIRERVFLPLEVGLPGFGIPDLEPGVRADHDAFAPQCRVLAQRGGDRHPALLVRDLVRGAREEYPAVVAYRLGSHGRDAQRLGDPAEFRLREYVQTALLALRQHEPFRQFVAVFRGEEDPALVIQPGRVRTEKHRHSPPLPPTTPVRETLAAPPRTTVLHIAPPSTTGSLYPGS